MIAEYKTKRKLLEKIENTDPIWKWMTPDPRTVLPSQTIREVVSLLESYQINGLPVVDEARKVIGIITKSTIINCFMEGLSPEILVEDVMIQSVITIGKNESIMNAYGITAELLPVVDGEGRIVGILTHTDLLHSYASNLEQLQESLHAVETLRIILESAYEGIAVIDSNGNIVEFNQAYSRFIGVKREDVLGKHATTVIENTRLHVVIETGVPERGYIQRIQGQDMVVHRIPIWKDEKVVGAIGMLIFHGVTELYDILGRMQELSRQVAENILPAEPENKNESRFDHIIARSEKIQAVISIVRKAAKTPSTVLITGDSGTGKEVFATAIHKLSPYAEGPLISVNCAAIPEHLLEAELFGYEEGAFTGAKKGGKPGKFELAHKGTLFLDEIGDMPSIMQSKILRVLQEREVERIGGITKHRVDVRIIAATNRRLELMVKEGEFREDLYYRLNIIRINLPPLRERKDDIPELLKYHLHQICNRFGIRQKSFSNDALVALINYHWPGNVRELVNVVEMLVSLTDSDVIQVHDLPPQIYETQSLSSRSVLTLQEDQPEKSLLIDVKDKALACEKELIVKTIIETNGNKAGAARKLGIQRSTLYEKLKKHGLYNKVSD
ncbi:sigma 54-interacting transcriptional regulator [Neobacillus niacini]|uniref:sigma 54-interacting transcriptional regulator n=1 Tax=Neobacillus niacini TaxID=86668 RepID=UPI002FFF36AB